MCPCSSMPRPHSLDGRVQAGEPAVRRVVPVAAVLRGRMGQQHVHPATIPPLPPGRHPGHLRRPPRLLALRPLVGTVVVPDRAAEPRDPQAGDVHDLPVRVHPAVRTRPLHRQSVADPQARGARARTGPRRGCPARTRTACSARWPGTRGSRTAGHRHRAPPRRRRPARGPSRSTAARRFRRRRTVLSARHRAYGNRRPVRLVPSLRATHYPQTRMSGNLQGADTNGGPAERGDRGDRRLQLTSTSAVE